MVPLPLQSALRFRELPGGDSAPAARPLRRGSPPPPFSSLQRPSKFGGGDTLPEQPAAKRARQAAAGLEDAVARRSGAVAFAASVAAAPVQLNFVYNLEQPPARATIPQRALAALSPNELSQVQAYMSGTSMTRLLIDKLSATISAVNRV